jgi:ribosomal protein L20
LKKTKEARRRNDTLLPSAAGRAGSLRTGCRNPIAANEKAQSYGYVTLRPY